MRGPGAGLGLYLGSGCRRPRVPGECRSCADRRLSRSNSGNHRWRCAAHPTRMRRPGLGRHRGVAGLEAAPMRIVVLDGYTLNPGDLSWDALKALGPCEIHDRTALAELPSRTADREILLTNKMLLNRATIEGLPKLKYIGVTATGTNIVDLDAARERGILVTNVPAYGTASVAQTTMALLLELCHGAGHHAQTVRQGRWSQSLDFCYWDQPLIELSGLTLGIVGFGRIGRCVAELANAFGMKVLAYAPRQKCEPAFVRWVDLETLFRQSDVVTLHC